MSNTHFFSEYGHVAYQINGNDACSNMVAIFSPTYTPSSLGWVEKSKKKILKVVKLHINLKGMARRAQ